MRPGMLGLFFPPPFDFVKFYLWDNRVNFIETYCDTLYQITKETLIPRYFFSWGRYNAPYSKQLEIKENGHYYDYFYIIDIDENKNNIFLRIFFNKLEYLAFIEKENSKVTFCKIGDSGLSGFKDDIDDLMDVIPQDITPNNEMIYIIQPATVIKWLKENPEKASQARNKIQWIERKRVQ